MSNQTVPIFLYLIAAISGAMGQYFYKLGGEQIGIIPIYKNYPIFIGIILFCVVMILFVTAFKFGGKISVVYPVYATTFIWGALIATFIAKEPFSLHQVFGISIIVAGVILISVGET